MYEVLDWLYLHTWQETILHTFLVIVSLSFPTVFAPLSSSVPWTAPPPLSFLLSLCTSSRGGHLLPARDTCGIFLESNSRWDIWKLYLPRNVAALEGASQHTWRQCLQYGVCASSPYSVTTSKNLWSTNMMLETQQCFWIACLINFIARFLIFILSISKVVDCT